MTLLKQLEVTQQIDFTVTAISYATFTYILFPIKLYGLGYACEQRLAVSHVEPRRGRIDMLS